MSSKTGGGKTRAKSRFNTLTGTEKGNRTRPRRTVNGGDLGGGGLGSSKKIAGRKGIWEKKKEKEVPLAQAYLE